MRAFLIACALAALTGTAAAAGSGLAFLRLGGGARAASLAEATTALSDAGAAANPAALAPARAIALSHTEWIGGTRHEHAGGAVATGDSGAVAFELLVARAGGLERRVGPSAEPLGEFGVYEWSAGVAGSHPLGQRLRLGLGLKYLRQSIYSHAASGAALDLGALWRVRRWWIGGAVRNAGLMSALDRDATPLPLQLRLGIAASLRGALVAAADGHWTRDRDPSLHVGLEWRAARSLVLRGGYQTAAARDLTLGAGVVAGPWRVDYAFIPFASGLGDAHRLGLLWMGG